MLSISSIVLCNDAGKRKSTDVDVCTNPVLVMMANLTAGVLTYTVIGCSLLSTRACVCRINPLCQITSSSITIANVWSRQPSHQQLRV